jgi:hypothetical protein
MGNSPSRPLRLNGEGCTQCFYCRLGSNTWRYVSERIFKGLLTTVASVTTPSMAPGLGVEDPAAGVAAPLGFGLLPPKRIAEQLKVGTSALEAVHC